MSAFLFGYWFNSTKAYATSLFQRRVQGTTVSAIGKEIRFLCTNGAIADIAGIQREP